MYNACDMLTYLWMRNRVSCACEQSLLTGYFKSPIVQFHGFVTLKFWNLENDDVACNPRILFPKTTINNKGKMHIYDFWSKALWLQNILDLCCPFRTVIRSRPKMNKSSFVALSLGLLAVLSCLDLVVHGKPASNLCCRFENSPCCPTGRLQASSISARLKRRTQAIAVESTLLGNFHDAKAEVGHPGVQNHWRVLHQSLTYKPQTLRRKGT